MEQVPELIQVRCGVALPVRPIVGVQLDEHPIVFARDALRITLPIPSGSAVGEIICRLRRKEPQFHITGISLQSLGEIDQRLLSHRSRAGFFTGTH